MAAHDAAAREVGNGAKVLRCLEWDATGSARALPFGSIAAVRDVGILKARAAIGEVEPVSFVLHATEAISGIALSTEPSSGGADARALPAEWVETFVVKSWFQASDRTVYKGRRPYLVPELLLTDDDLVRVDLERKTNELRIDRSGRREYVPMNAPGDALHPAAILAERVGFQPFNLMASESKQVWLRIRVPRSASPGLYRGRVTISSSDRSSFGVPLIVEVLPISLGEPRLKMALYYRGQTREGAVPPRESVWKTRSQLEMDLSDMRDHGVLYPTVYYWESRTRTRTHLEADLAARDRVGLPKDPTYFIGVYPGSPRDAAGLKALRAKVTSWLEFFAKTGRSEIYFYGKDEAKGQAIRDQRPAWLEVRGRGARMFVAGSDELSSTAADVLDLAVVAGPLDARIADRIHKHGNAIFSYANPQVGLEDPDRYRRSYGFELWRAGYDGAMTYAYNEANGDPWNDFDGKANFRDLMFSYPTDRGLIPTVQWEGLREGVDDLRYLAELQRRVESLEDGEKKEIHIEWMKSIDSARPPAEIRREIIDRILRLDGVIE
jgi:hypothetical protein